MAERIKRAHAEKVHQYLGPTVGYLHRLRERMEKVGFVPSDRLYERVTEAYNAMHALSMHLHYISCEGTGMTLPE
jgi:hypothetical protein